MRKSRTDKAIRNSSVAAICHILHIVVSFVSRTFFTYILGAEYLGIGGLFTNILTVLNFAELGLGTALVYRFYAPLAVHDNNKVCLWLQLYRRAYFFIIATIAILGLAVIPFLPYLVSAPAVKEDLALLYCLYLLQTLFSYFFVYKKTLLIADQNDYIVTIFTQITTICANVIQCVILYFTHNYVMYCLVMIFFVLLNNVLCSKYAEKKYPYILDQPEGRLSEFDRDALKDDVKGLLLRQLASISFGGTMNMFISAFIGIRYVGILLNYTLILSVINGILNKIFGSVMAIVGNLGVCEDRSRTEEILYKMFFLNTALYGYICVGMILLLPEFVTKIWLTDEYVLNYAVVILAVVELFSRSIHYPIFTVRHALGLFSQKQWYLLVLAIVNVVLDFFVVRDFGIVGLFVVLLLCRGCTYFVDAFVVYSYGFHKSSKKYFQQIGLWVAFLIVSALVAQFCLRYVVWIGISGFIARILVVTLVYFLLFIPCYYRTQEFKYFVELIKKRFCGRKVI